MAAHGKALKLNEMTIHGRKCGFVFLAWNGRIEIGFAEDAVTFGVVAVVPATGPREDGAVGRPRAV